MAHRRVHGKHLQLGGDSGYGGSSTASTDLGYGGSSTASTDLGYRGSLIASTDLGYGISSAAATSTSHLVECYQKISLHSHDEDKLRYA